MPVSGPSTRRRRIVALGATTLLLISIELLARALLPSSDAAPLRMLRLPLIRSDGAISPDDPDLQRLLVADPDLGWTLRPDVDLVATRLSLGAQRPWRVTTDAQGHRPTGELPPPPGQALDVLILGGSVAFGWGVDDGETFAALLDAAQPGSVSNLAVPGYSSAQGRAILARALQALRPARLVLSFGEADAWPVLVDDAAWLAGRRGARGQQVEQLRGTRFVQLLAPPASRIGQRLAPAARAAGLTRPRVPAARFSANLAAMADRVRETWLVDACAPQDYGAAMAALDQARSDVHLLVYAQVHGEQLDGCHPTPAGHRALAGALQRTTAGGPR